MLIFEASVWKTVLTRTAQAGTPMAGFSASIPVRNQCLLFKPTTDGILSRKPKAKTRQL